jgi:hypothetical protein
MLLQTGCQGALLKQHFLFAVRAGKELLLDTF